ncbi:hypothetical protein [Acinetobacter rathckeae]|nr:hypothetical protein [Acinetobacter rathckeae]MBF7689073.1 hypothetical protein [Acinetobacter rathckeae]MBF7696593.1 hypothetical protein [Acinetobacter rathckeae]
MNTVNHTAEKMKPDNAMYQLKIIAGCSILYVGSFLLVCKIFSTIL